MPLLKVQWLMYLIRVVYWQRTEKYVYDNVDPLNCNASHFVILLRTTSDKFYSSMEGSYALVDKIRHRAHRHLIRYYILPIAAAIYKIAATEYKIAAAIYENAQQQRYIKLPQQNIKLQQ
jgi:hypothetical protein